MDQAVGWLGRQVEFSRENAVEKWEAPGREEWARRHIPLARVSVAVQAGAPRRPPAAPARRP